MANCQHRCFSAQRAPFDTAAEKTRPAQGERELPKQIDNITARPEEASSFQAPSRRAPALTLSARIPYRWVTALLVLLTLAGCLIGILVPAGIGWDFACFYDAGRKALAGQIADLYNPLARIGGQAPQGQMAFWGAPLSSYFYAPMGWFSPRVALTLFKLQSTLAIFAALVLLYVHTRKFVEPAAQERFAAWLALLACVYQPFWTIYRVGGQTTPTVLLLLVAGLLCHTASRFFLSSLCVIVAALIKPTFASLLVALLLVSGPRFVRAAFAVLLVVGVVSVVTMGWPVHQEFLVRLRQGTSSSTVWVYNSALTVWIENLRLLSDPQPTAMSRPLALSAAIMAVRVTVLVLFVHLYRQARTQPWSAAARRHCQFLMAILFSLLIAPVVWEHYLALLFVPLIYVVASQRSFSPAARVLVVWIFVLALGQNLIFINWLSTRFTFDAPVELLAVGLFKSAPLVLTFILLWRHAGELFVSYTTPAWNALR
jgi:hypothetical protein